MNAGFLFLGTLVGYGGAFLIAGQRSGKDGILKSIRIKFKRYCIHIHHWLWALLFLILLIIFNYYHDIIYGVLIGLIIQGLTYRDFYRIIQIQMVR